MEAVFWIVCRDPMTYDKVRFLAVERHGSLEEAQTEARRLASKEGCRFYVFQVIGAVIPQAPPVAWIPYGDNTGAKMPEER